VASILGVGVATLDIINYVARYPEENQALRASNQRISCGGNATNTLTILSRLGHRVALAAVLATDHQAGIIYRALQDQQIDISACVHLPGKSPLSCVVVAQETASRTIVHYRELPELSASSFIEQDLAGYDWIHFEGRNIEQTEQMMMHVRRYYPGIRLSLEVEKPRDGIAALFSFADLILFSASYVRSQGTLADQQWLLSIQQQAKQAIVVCSDAERGAWACDVAGNTYHAPAVAPAKLIDTLGAGDTFNAAMIHALLDEQSLQAALCMACQLAGDKCGQQGLGGPA